MLCAQVPTSKIIEVVGVSKPLISRVRARLEAGEDLTEKKHGGQNKILTKTFLKRLEKEFKANPFISAGEKAKEKGVSLRTVLRGLKKIDMESRVRPHRHFLSETTQYTRVMKAKRLLNRLKKRKADTVIIFSDKKMFTAVHGGLGLKTPPAAAWSPRMLRPFL